jgi:hypothetical protein
LVQVFAIGPVTAIRELRGTSQITTYYETLVARHAHEHPDTDAEDAACEEIAAALSMFAPTVQARWRNVIPELP